MPFPCASPSGFLVGDGDRSGAMTVTTAGQYRRFNCRMRSNWAVSATAITAMTPAWTGSVTTRSAASGTVPAMFSEITNNPLPRTSSTAVAISPAHQRTGEHEQPDARKPDDRPDGRGERLLADEGNRVHRDVLAADVVAVGLGNGAERHLADLRAAPHDDDALAVHAREGRRLLGPLDAGDRADVLEQLPQVRLTDVELEVDLRDAAGDVQIHVRDVDLVIRNHLRQPEQHPGLVRHGHEHGVVLHQASQSNAPQ